MNATLPTFAIDDPAAQAVRAFIDLSETPCSTLAARAPLHWIEQTSALAWGAAAIPAGSVRRLWRQSGLPVVAEHFLEMPARHTRWLSLARHWERGTIQADDALFLARLLLYLGFDEDAATVAREAAAAAPDDARELHALLLLNQAGLAHAPERWAVDTLLDDPRVEELAPGALRFQIAMFLAGCTMRQPHGDAERATEWFSLAHRSLVDAPEFFESPVTRALALARYRRQRGDFHARFEADRDARDASLAEALDALDGGRAAATDDGDRYLLDEAERCVRLCELSAADDDGTPEKALLSAWRLVELDPWCAQALTVAARTALRAGDIPRAKEWFSRARVVGTFERPFALSMLAGLEQHPSLRETLVVAAAEAGLAFHPEALAGVRERMPMDVGPAAGSTWHWIQRLREGSDRPPAVPVSASDAQSMVHPSRRYPDADDALVRSECYRRMLPFWELRLDPDAATPNLARAPLAVWDCLRQRRDPLFRSTVTWRLAPEGFREQLVRASVADPALAARAFSASTTLEGLRGRSERVDTLYALVEDADALDPMDRAQVGHLLATMGLHDDAARVAQPMARDVAWGTGECVLAAASVRLRHARHDTDPEPLDAFAEYAYGRMPVCEETLRARLTVAVVASSHGARTRDLTAVGRWDPRVRALASEVRRAGRFDDFERDLLSSAAYRAMLALPLLTADRDGLRAQALLCEVHARAAFPKQSVDEAFAVDNLQVSLEVTARVWASLGEVGRARDTLEEVTRLDPWGATAWLRYAALLERSDALEPALDAYLRAVRLSPPGGASAAHRAARCAERLGRSSMARELYLLALRARPGAAAPLARLVEIADADCDLYLRRWAARSLARARRSNAIELDDDPRPSQIPPLAA